MLGLTISLPFTTGLSGAFGLLLASFVSLISVADPFGTMPVFMSLTAQNSNEERADIAKKSAIFMFGILIVFLFAGTYIISFFGISMPGIRVAGGIIILRSAWIMLTTGEDDKITDEDKKTAKAKDTIAFSPLAMPLLAGPGSIAVVIGMASHSAGSLGHYTIISGSVFLCAVVSYVIFRLGSFFSKYIGPAGMHVITRLMGFIVMAISVQFILSGIKEFFTG